MDPPDPAHILSRRRLLAVSAAAVTLAGCRATAPVRDPASAEFGERISLIDRALTRSANYLLDCQEADGAWRRSIYGFMKDGPSLTPHVLTAILFLPQGGSRATEAFARGADYLAGLIDDDGNVPQELNLVYPVYTAADTVRLLSHSPRHATAKAAWLAHIRGQQLNEELGWLPQDVEYGGWSYAARPPRKLAGGARGAWDFSNLSATLYGLAALSGGKISATDKSYAQALVFVQRCQNYAAADAGPLDDGGFCFCPGDALHNKAGLAGIDALGRRRFNSYGSMTCDGLRALLLCGLSASHPRVVAARAWLARNFNALHNPGRFAPGTEDIRDATYYYYTWSLAHAAMRSGVNLTADGAGVRNWPVVLSEELLARQREDGAWVNRFTDAKEDDPLVATPLAASALAICRHVMAGGDVPTVRGALLSCRRPE